MVKSAPILHLLDKDTDIVLQLIHSGQHYDFEMSKIFFNELYLPQPLFNLNVGSGSHATQTARLMLRIEKIIYELKPDLVMVFGDANTTLGGALGAIKLHVPVCHVEAGLRTYEMSAPEEVNRVLTDHCSHMLCAPTEEAVRNLKAEGIKEENILLSGDTMYDAILKHEEDLEKSTIINDLELTRESYIVLTLHRVENVENIPRLRRIISAITKIRSATIVFPVHPRTAKKLEETRLKRTLSQSPNVVLTKPLSYFDMLNLMKKSCAVLTDSGGMEKEAFLLHVPCVTMRYKTGWVETVEMGANRLVGAETDLILSEIEKILQTRNAKDRLERLPNPYGDGNASGKIVKDLKDRFYSGKLSVKTLNAFC
jgi:UDP-N-acetylglucosamine 2-epimerase (non-hydrolysing)